MGYQISFESAGGAEFFKFDINNIIMVAYVIRLVNISHVPIRRNYVAYYINIRFLHERVLIRGKIIIIRLVIIRIYQIGKTLNTLSAPSRVLHI